MKKRTFLYIPALILFIFALSAMIVHFSRMVERQRTMTTDVRMPFNYNNGRVLSLLPEGERLGIKVGDRITAINGRELTDTLVWREELAKGGQSGQVNLSMARTTENGQIESIDVAAPLVKVEKTLGFYATQVEERLNRELKIAREVQERLFPQELPAPKASITSARAARLWESAAIITIFWPCRTATSASRSATFRAKASARR
jgi:hypothetical protein